jgi:hypothetical protein
VVGEPGVWRAVAVIAVVAGCHGEAGDRAQATRELGACIEAIDRAPRLAAGQRLDALATGCAPACDGLAAWAAARGQGVGPGPADLRRHRLEPGEVAPPAADPELALLRGCRALCSEAAEQAVAAAAPGDRWPALLTACGAARFGLSADRADLASDTWLVLQRINHWLERMRRATVDDDQLPAQLERATLRALFRLPLPAHHADAGYRLPPSTRGVASDALLYLIVTETGLRVGSVPQVRLRGPELELRPGPGGPLPGQLVEPGQAATLARRYASYVEREDPDAAGRPPLLLVDAAVSADRLLAVIGELGVPRVELAVDGGGALAHRVALETGRPENAAAPVIRVGVDRIDIQGLSDDRATTFERLGTELRHFAAVNAPVRRAELALAVPATAADIVKVLDACAEAKLDALVVPAPPPAPSPSPSLTPSPSR